MKKTLFFAVLCAFVFIGCTETQDLGEGDGGNNGGGGNGGGTTYTISFNSQGGSSHSPMTGAAGSQITLPTPTRENHSFNGWFSAASGGDRFGGGGVSFTITRTLTMHAQWTQDGGGGGNPTVFTVTFNSQGGSNHPSLSQEEGLMITLPTPTRNNHSFDGWFSEAQGGDRFGGGGDTYTITGYVTMYARWSQQINWNAAQIAISTEGHLREIATLVNAGTNNFNGRTITLMSNIEIQGGGWVPIGGTGMPGTGGWRQFQGTFDGNGNVVSGIRINNTSDFQGFFGSVGLSGTVRNLGVIVDIVGGGTVGGLVGRNEGTIEFCFVEGSITGSGNHIGGLVGLNDRTIRNSYAIAIVHGNNIVGGLAGGYSAREFGLGSHIENTFAISDVSAVGNNTNVGGLLGDYVHASVDNSVRRNSYASGNVVGNRLVGSSVSIPNNTLRTEAEMRQQETFTNWDFSAIWRITPDINNGFPHLRVFQ